MIVLLVVLAVAAETVITAMIAKSRGRSVTEGVLLGLFLGLIGLVIEACLPSHRAAMLARQAKARQPLRINEGVRMLADLKRDREG